MRSLKRKPSEGPILLLSTKCPSDVFLCLKLCGCWQLRFAVLNFTHSSHALSLLELPKFVLLFIKHFITGHLLFFFKESLNISAESAFVFCMIFNYSGALMHIRSFGWKPRWISGTHSKCLITHFKKHINPPCFLYLFTLVVFCSMSMKCFHLLFAVYIDLVIRRVGSDLSPSLKCHFNNRSPNFLFLYKHGLACSAFCGFLYS